MLRICRGKTNAQQLSRMSLQGICKKRGWCRTYESYRGFNYSITEKEDERNKNTVLWVLAIIGAVAAVAGIAYAVYRFFTPDYLEDFEEDFDDDFDDYFEDEDEEKEGQE